MTVETPAGSVGHHLLPTIWLQRGLISQLIARDITSRYRGSVLGIAWSMGTPLFMLAVFTFVFGTVFQARWSGGAGATPSMAEFAIILFAGMTVYQLFSDVVTRAPSLMLSNINYVKKIVFPIEVLPVVALGSALFHAGVSLAVLLAFMLAVMGHIPATALLLPLVIAPFAALVLGLAWFLAATGVYVRDIGQVLGPLITALMFLSPIFYPASALPEWVRPYLVLNPVAVPVEATRKVLIWGELPDWPSLGLYAIIALATVGLGRLWFEKTRKGFADVL